MIEVSEFSIYILISIFAGEGSGWTERVLCKLPKDDYATFDQILMNEVRPSFLLCSDVEQKQMKDSLKWFINVGHEYESPEDERHQMCRFSRFFGTYHIAIKEPTDFKEFFIHVWKFLFGDEPYHIEDLSVYVEKDLNEANRVRVSY